MELWKKQKRIAAAFGVFLCLMLLCTLISRAVYASGLPQVTTEKPRSMELEHKVAAEGIVSQGQEYAVNTLSGLRCKTVSVHLGDYVTGETVLFEVDTEDLAEQIEEQELEIKKLGLTIQAQEQNRALEENERKTEKERAGEDYERAKESAEDAVNQAESTLNQAKSALEVLKQNPPAAASENDSGTDEGQGAANEAGEGQETEGGEIEGEETEGGTDEGQEDKNQEAQAAREKWEAEVKEQEAAVRAAEAALKAAKADRESALLEAERSLSDAKAASASDNSLEINRLELQALQKKLEKYKDVRDAGGKIYPEAEGIVTSIRVSPGERIPDGAAIVCADLESPLEFHISLTAAQKKYVNLGDAVKLSLGNSSESVTVDYIAESGSSPELYDIVIFLPEGVGSIGQSGSFEASSRTEKFSCCIPIAALHEDENQRKYVYVLSQRSGILGTELSAEKLYVTVLDQNESYAALEAGSIDSDTELIVSSTKDLNDRDIVRYKE